MTASELKKMLKLEILDSFQDFLENIRQQNETFRTEMTRTVARIETAFETNNTLMMKELNQHTTRIDKLEKESRETYGVLTEIRSTMQTIAKYNPSKMSNDIKQAHEKIRHNTSKINIVGEAPGISASKSLDKIKFAVVGCLVSGLIGTVYFIIQGVLK